MTRDKTLAYVRRVLVENAALLGEPQEVFLRERTDGTFRLQVKKGGRWERGAHKDYSTLASLRWAAGVANERAREIAKRRAS